MSGSTFILARGSPCSGRTGQGRPPWCFHLNGIIEPDSGTVRVAGLPVVPEHLMEVRRRTGVVFQDPDDQLFMPTVWKDVAFGPANYGLRARRWRPGSAAALEPWVCRRWLNGHLTISAWGSGAGWRWPPCWQWSLRSWCSTSPPPTSTRRAAASWRRSSPLLTMPMVTHDSLMPWNCAREPCHQRRPDRRRRLDRDLLSDADSWQRTGWSCRSGSTRGWWSPRAADRPQPLGLLWVSPTTCSPADPRRVSRREWMPAAGCRMRRRSWRRWSRRGRRRTSRGHRTRHTRWPPETRGRRGTRLTGSGPGRRGRRWPLRDGPGRRRRRTGPRGPGRRLGLDQCRLVDALQTPRGEEVEDHDIAAVGGEIDFADRRSRRGRESSGADWPIIGDVLSPGPPRTGR